MATNIYLKDHDWYTNYYKKSFNSFVSFEVRDCYIQLCPDARCSRYNEITEEGSNFWIETLQTRH